MYGCHSATVDGRVTLWGKEGRSTQRQYHTLLDFVVVLLILSPGTRLGAYEPAFAPRVSCRTIPTLRVFWLVSTPAFKRRCTPSRTRRLFAHTFPPTPDPIKPPQGRLWQLGVAMAALDAHLRHTALSSEAPSVPPAGDPFWEAGGLLLAAVIEHACFAAGAVGFASSRIRTAAAARRNRSRQGGRRRSRNRNADDDGGSREDADLDDRGGGGGDDDGWGSGVDGGLPGGNSDGEQEYEDGYESSSSYSLPPAQSESAATTVATAPSAATVVLAAVSPADGSGTGDAVPHATKMYMAVVYPLFFRLLAAFVMIWDRQVRLPAVKRRKAGLLPKECALIFVCELF